jgi:hypothetical protein
MVLRLDRDLMGKLDKAAAAAYRSREGFVREILAAKLGTAPKTSTNRASYIQRLRSK